MDVARSNRKRKQGTNKLPFSRILRNVMQERNLTIRAVAAMSGVSPSVVQGWLSSVNPHDLHAVARLAHALGLSFKGLLLGEPELTPANWTEFFDEEDVFEGLCRVSIQRLNPRVKAEDLEKKKS